MAGEISLTAIRAQQARLDVAAHNIANVETPGFSFYRALLAAGAEQRGVQLQAVEQPRAPGDGGAPGAEAGEAAMAETPPPSNVEPATELVSMIESQRAFEANIRVIETEHANQRFLNGRLI